VEPVIDVHIPKLGMSTVEVDIVAVHVAPGDAVEPTAILLEVESEKANFELEAGHSGTVREVLVREGDEARVGDVVVRIEPHEHEANRGVRSQSPM
jgi:pyruvate/2-oxoglutarate dehydrogenase complex dihydrolipoamide acyltransferase (E2) component